MLSQLRRQQPGISDGALINSMNAAFCPVVANAPGLSGGQKRARLLQLDGIVQQDVAITAPTH